MGSWTSSQGEEDRILTVIRRILDGDIEAFAEIIRTYERLIAADLARRLPAQDVAEVAQDAFVRAFRALHSYRGTAPFRCWLLQIARRAAMDFWRKKYRRRERLFSELDEAAHRHLEARRQAHCAEAQAAREAQDSARELLEDALRQLPPDDRAIITLVELEDRSMQEAARELGCGLSAAKVRAFRARRRLRTILEHLQQALNSQK